MPVSSQGLEESPGTRKAFHSAKQRSIIYRCSCIPRPVGYILCRRYLSKGISMVIRKRVPVALTYARNCFYAVRSLPEWPSVTLEMAFSHFHAMAHVHVPIVRRSVKDHQTSSFDNGMTRRCSRPLSRGLIHP
jgi:hypothetical protein